MSERPRTTQQSNIYPILANHWWQCFAIDPSALGNAFRVAQIVFVQLLILVNLSPGSPLDAQVCNSEPVVELGLQRQAEHLFEIFGVM